MSKFSDAYYLLDTDTKTSKVLLKKVGRFAILFPPNGRWTPVLVEGPTEAGGPLNEFIQHATCTWMHYAYAEDQGLWLRFFRGTEAALQIDLQRRGPSELSLDEVAGALRRLEVIDEAKIVAFKQTVLPAKESAALDLESVRDSLSEVLGVRLMVHTSCADLTYKSVKTLSREEPAAEFVLKSKRGKYQQIIPQSKPNEFCPFPGLPPFMYLPLPVGEADPEMISKHVRHWVETGDFDEKAQEGFWLYTAYSRALPTRYRFLADRVMNLTSFPNYEQTLRRTIQSILAVSESSFDWAPYLERRKGTQRL